MKRMLANLRDDDQQLRRPKVAPPIDSHLHHDPLKINRFNHRKVHPLPQNLAQVGISQRSVNHVYPCVNDVLVAHVYVSTGREAIRMMMIHTKRTISMILMMKIQMTKDMMKTIGEKKVAKKKNLIRIILRNMIVRRNQSRPMLSFSQPKRLALPAREKLPNHQGRNPNHPG